MAATAAKLLPPGTSRVGGTYAKAQYREYTDGSFKTLKKRGPEWDHLGNLGPALYGSVGDVIRIVFRNTLPFPANLVPTGGLVTWDGPAGSGSGSGSGLKSADLGPVPPGGVVTYLYRVPEEAGPPAGATVTSRMWLYRSSADPVGHDNAGLLGPLIVVARGAAGPRGGRPADVDREVVTIFQVVDETASALAAQHDPALTAGTSPSQNVMNGYVWCNAPPDSLVLHVGERVRWHVASVGSHDGLHNYHWHGHGVELNGHHVDQFTAIPTAAYSVNMRPDEPGVWLFHCHVNSHMGGGMAGVYTVKGPAAPLPASGGGGVQRTYFVAAEEVAWSYLGASGGDQCTSPAAPITSAHPGWPYVAGPTASSPRPAQAGAGGGDWGMGSVPMMGKTYTKTLYVEYTDETFTKPKLRGPSDEYLGLLGPVIRAEVGDTVKVVFRNKAKITCSLHAHGVRYDKGSEGTMYEDGSPPEQKLDDAVAPGQTYTYTWHVMDRSGPGPADPSSLVWLYHGHLDEAAESNAGLVGAIIITARGKARSPSDPSPADVDRELALLFTVTDEVTSSNFMTNLARVDPTLALQPARVEALLGVQAFKDAQLKHNINGFLYCNMPPPRVVLGERLRVHMLSVGSVKDTHTPHLGGPRFEALGQRSDSMQLSPGGLVSADVELTNPGTFEVQCRVAHHVMAGMRAHYIVVPPPTAESGSGSGTNTTESPSAANATDPASGSAPPSPPLPVARRPDGEVTRLSGVTRTYYVRVETVDWDYAPGGYIRCTRVDLSHDSSTYLQRGARALGSRYRKAVYREYTDASFATPRQQRACHGLTGPTLVAEVGDMLEVHLASALTDLPGYAVDLSPGGGLVEAGSQGPCAGGGALAPGESCTYRWLVPESAGPGPADFNTVAYAYTSAADVARAPSLGLAGLLVVAGRGQLVEAPSGEVLPRGVDVMLPLYWQIMDENSSPYLAANIAAAGLNESALGNLKENHGEDGMGATNADAMHQAHGAMGGDFHESNRIHAINGFTYCNLPRPKVRSGQTVRWLHLAYGSESEFHSPYFENQVVQADRMGWSTLPSLMPSTARVSDMRAGAPGTWLLYCDVHHDYEAGMIGQFDVEA
ncbi:hypothetical protein HYH03_017507 [Edaphochlamys debaryana]|uniref:Uncharacterized protein n=1 Tax=Edaphochlamys debaryana TaxID=47281 RepID=A0A835XHR6_9CHLO|nr:hypothetical protein HYH03_017507 [Edaphochlamys debaryana]|eukprot:KAG2483629.1 hypothetical protein HYH03_017507 [Edaphochlamys debaryana]